MKIEIELPEVADSLYEWCFLVKLRDDYTCQECGIRNKNNGIAAHHIDTSQKLILITDNGMTLCQKCHSRAHAILRHNKNQKVMQKIQLPDFADNKFFSVKQMAKILQCSRSLVLGLIYDKKLKANKVLNSHNLPTWQISKDDSDTFISLYKKNYYL